MTDGMMTWLFSGMGGFCFQVVILETVVLATGLAAVRFFSQSSRPARYLVLQVTLGFALLTPLLVTAVQWSNLGWISRPVESGLAVAFEPNGSGFELDGMNERLELQRRRERIRGDEMIAGGEEGASASEGNLVSADQSEPRTVSGSALSSSMAEAVEVPSRTGRRQAIGSVLSLAGRVLLVVWLLVAVCLVWRMLSGYREVLRLRALLVPVESVRVLAILDEVVAETAGARVPRLMADPAVPAPMTIGLFRPVIALPSSLLSDGTDSAALKAVLLHETAHTVRRDLVTAFLERLATAFHWWHPLIYRVCSRMDELREDICDNWAVRAQGQGETLARCLVDLAAAMCEQHSGQKRLSTPPRLTVGALGLDNNGLQTRVARLLRLGRQRTGGNNLPEGKETMIQTTWRARVGVGVLTLMLLGLFLATGIRRVPAEEAEPAEGPAEATATKARGEGIPAVSGVIVDPAGKAVGGAKVWLVKRGERWPDPVITDDAGRYSIAYDRPKETTHFSLWAESADGAKSGAKGFGIPGTGKEEPLDPITVQLGGIRIVGVSVKNGEGRPIPGAEVELVPCRDQHLSSVIAPRTDADGTTRVRLPEDVKISFVLALKPGDGLDYFANCTGTFRANDTIPERIDLCLRGATTVRLRINDTKGDPIAGLPLSAMDDLKVPGQTQRLCYSGGVITKTKTDEQGEVLFDWLPTGVANDRFTVHPRSDEWNRKRMSVQDYLSNPEVTVVLKRRQIISGRVTLPDGRPAEGARVFAEGVDPENVFSRTFAAEDTGEDGTYSIRTNAGMIYVLRAECEGWAATYRMPIELAEDRPTENVDFRLSKGTLVHGTVRLSGDMDDLTEGRSNMPNVFMGLEADGLADPIPELWKHHYHISVGWKYPDFEDGEGEYSFRVAPGDYVVDLQLPGKSSEPIKVSVEDENEIKIDFDRSMPKNRQLQIRTVLADDPSETVPSVVVRYVAYTRWAWVGDFFATGDNGECTNPTTGNEQFHRGRTKDLRLGGKATIDGEVTSVTISMASTATVRGRFVDKEGKPLANRKVEVFYRPEIDRVNWDRDDEIDGRTDASGSFEIRGLIAGIEYQVLLAGTWEWKKGKPTNGTPVTAKAGETINVGDIVIAGG
jgi:BlaR1 peptidase M56